MSHARYHAEADVIVAATSADVLNADILMAMGRRNFEAVWGLRQCREVSAKVLPTDCI